MNPFEPPTALLGEGAPEAPAQPSFARRTSVALGVAGVVGFWGAVVVLFASGGWEEELSPAATNILGMALLLAVTAHVVGLTVVFVAPPGRRWPGILVNTLAVAVLTAAAILGMVQ